MKRKAVARLGKRWFRFKIKVCAQTLTVPPDHASLQTSSRPRSSLRHIRSAPSSHTHTSLRIALGHSIHTGHTPRRHRHHTPRPASLAFIIAIKFDPRRWLRLGLYPLRMRMRRGRPGYKGVIPKPRVTRTTTSGLWVHLGQRMHMEGWTSIRRES